MFRKVLRVLASGLLIVSCAASSHAAEEAAVKAAISELLNVGWATSPKDRIAADLQYDEVRSVAGGDPRGLAASLLVLLQQRRYEEAARRADELLAKNPADPWALRSKVWLAAVLKNYEATMVTADRLSEQLAANPPKDEAQQAEQDEVHAFLGRIFGFLGGPAAEAANQVQRKTYEQQIVLRIEASRRAKFEEARDGVIDKFLDMTGAKDEERDRAVAQAQAAKEKTLKEIEAEREAIAGRGKELDERKDQLQDELREELAAIAKEDQPLVQELNRLDVRADSLNRDLFNYDSEIGRLDAAAAAEKDPDLRFRLQREADRLSQIASRIESDLYAVRRLIGGVQGQRATLAVRQGKATGTAAGQVQRIDQEVSTLIKRDRRNEGIERRAGKPATGTTGKVRSLAAQAMALSTYDQLPLEVARRKLLDELR